MTTPGQSLFEQHQDLLSDAIAACRTRSFFSGYVESPSGKLHPDGAAQAGKDRFDAQLGRPFALEQPGEIGRTGLEISPYTQEALGIDYPKIDVDTAFLKARSAMPGWRKASIEERAGVCLEMTKALESQSFENAHATMHTAGQSFLMAFSGSGANALDRGLEAIAYAYRAMNDIPGEASWTKSFGRAGEVTLEKSYRLCPRGVAVVVCCATFPLWNAYPALFANLMTANPVILKPHPNGILPVAMMARTCRRVLEKAGFDPNLVLLAADTADAPVTIDFVNHPDCAIIDYTGSQRFGAWIEKNCAEKLIYTETAGCNAVVIHSTEDIDGLTNGLANCLAGFSAQMCTTPQNIHISAEGVDTNQGRLSFEEFRERLVDAIKARTSLGEKAAGLCGAVQSPTSLDIMEDLKQRIAGHGRIALDTRPYHHPEFPKARTATPLVLEVDADAGALYQEEHFAPVSFLIREENAEAALANAVANARQFGAIASYLYASDPAFLAQGKDAFAEAGASLWCNMTVPMPINFAAAYSDFHMTGLNPAGNACLTDLAFVANRFRIVQFREPKVLDGEPHAS